jgi:hypothetical protein
MSRSSLTTAAGTNPLWQDVLNVIEPWAHGSLVFPNRLNGTGLLVDEWRDNVWLRYNHSLLDMPDICNGCSAKMTVEHALLCKMGEGVLCISGTIMWQMNHMRDCILSLSDLPCGICFGGAPQWLLFSQIFVPRKPNTWMGKQSQISCVPLFQRVLLLA